MFSGRLHAIIDHINDIIASCNPAVPIVLSPLDGTVLFASGKQSWGFSLPQLARAAAAKRGVVAETLLSCMWGDVFFNPESGKWTKTAGPGRQRGFCKLVMEALVKG